MKKLLLIILACMVTGCSTMGIRSILKARPDAEVPEVVSAVQQGQNMRILVLMGGVAIIVGVGLRFASNNLLPKSTGIGIGIAAGGASCIATSILAPTLQRIALPLIIVVVVLAICWVIWRVFIAHKKSPGRR